MTDITRRGSREYDDATRDKVLHAFMRLVGKGKGVQVEDLAIASGVPGRTCRQVMADHDSAPLNGIVLVLTGGDDGYELATYAEDMDVLTKRLRAQALSLMERVQRREAAAKSLPVRQRGLFS
jgi:hypothetical protein